MKSILGFIAIVIVCCHAATCRADDRPNIVMIVGDDMGFGDFGFMGGKATKTPRLDKLAKESAVFPNGYVPTSLCRASLVTLLTGLYPYQHKVCCNDPPQGVDRTKMHPFIRNAPALPRLLKDAGYRSLQTGKFWEGHYANAGFTDGETTDKDRHISKEKPQIGRETMKPIYDFIDKGGDKPFFLWYAPMMPHLPHTPPDRLLKKYVDAGVDVKLAKYYAMCEWFDETCGQLLDHLDKKKLREKTLVFFVIDNGWVALKSTDENRPGGGPRGKLTPYEMGVRTPIMIRWPGHTKAGRYEDLVSTIDAAPTILTACGAKVPKQMPGLSLLDVAAGKGPLARKAVFGEIYRHSARDLSKPRLDILYRWVREGDWKLIVDVNGKKTQLFNVAKDPLEKKELGATDPERVKKMAEALDQLWKKK